MVDAVLVKRLLSDLREKKKLLERRRIKDLAAFRADPFLHNAVQHILEIMVEIIVDIGNHIIADEGWPMPSSNREIFETLEQKGVISADMMRLARKMVGFRNIVVHMYEKVDLEDVFTIYRRHLKDFEKFAVEIETFIGKQRRR